MDGGGRRWTEDGRRVGEVGGVGEVGEVGEVGGGRVSKTQRRNAAGVLLIDAGPANGDNNALE